jgi:hypothetical protein
MRGPGLTCALLALLVASGSAVAANGWPGAKAERQAVGYQAHYNALAEHAASGRGMRIVEMRCLPSTNGRYYCHTLFRPAQALRARAGEACLELELQPGPFTVLRTWPVVCDDGSGAVFAAMPKSLATPKSRLPGA